MIFEQRFKIVFKDGCESCVTLGIDTEKCDGGDINNFVNKFKKRFEGWAERIENGPLIPKKNQGS